MSDIEVPRSDGIEIPVDAPSVEKEPLGLASLIVGITSLPMSCCCGFFSIPIGIIAIVLGILSKKKHKEEPSKWASDGFALVGIICGSIGIFLGVVISILALVGEAAESSSQELMLRLWENAIKQASSKNQQ